jgi:hypothetical protein
MFLENFLALRQFECLKVNKSCLLSYHFLDLQELFGWYLVFPTTHYFVIVVFKAKSFFKTIKRLQQVISL